MRKKFISMILTVVMLLSLMPVIVQAAASGTCGTNLTWKLDDTGTLTISGTGDMYDYSEESPAPWSNNIIDIKQVTIKSGISRIGYMAFFNCWTLTKITIPDSVPRTGAEVIVP